MWRKTPKAPPRSKPRTTYRVPVTDPTTHERLGDVEVHDDDGSAVTTIPTRG